MDDKHKEIIAHIAIHEKVTDLFIRELIMHLELEVMPFDGKSFLDNLYLVQQSLPVPDNADLNNPTSHEEIALLLWKRKISCVEKALENAEYVRKRGD